MSVRDPTPIKAIDFKSLNQRVAPQSRQVAGTKSLLSGVTFYMLLAAGIAIFLAVFLILPKYVADQQAARLQPGPVESPKEAPRLVPKTSHLPTAELPISEPSIAELGTLKLQAEKLLLKIIQQQQTLRRQGAEIWAAEEFSQALIQGDTGDKHFREQNFIAAISAYERTVSALQRLQAQTAVTLADHLRQGQLALTRGERDAAIHHFQLARAIDAHNRQAQAGLTRAATIQELFALLQTGGNLEAGNRLQDAKQTYRQALDLDPSSPEARAALNRVIGRITEIEFSQLMVRGYAALEAGRYTDARAAFTAAQKLMPNSQPPTLGLTKVAQAIRHTKIASLSDEAQYFERREDWAYAVQSYQQILALSPDAAFAIKGLARSQRRVLLLSELDNHVENKARLHSAQVFAEARALLQKIAALEHPGDKITRRANSLENLLKLASQPIAITLQSDNRTEVVIFKVGQFGRFKNLQLHLKPGQYTLMGSRPGYRDVRKTLTVGADVAVRNVLIRCEEPI